MRTLRRLWLLVCLLSVMGLSGCSSTPTATAGDAAIRSDWTMPEGLAATDFQIPTGQLTISVGAPITDEARIKFSPDEGIAPPADGSLIPVKMDFFPSSGRTGSKTKPPLPAIATLTADGRTYRLPETYEVVEGKLDYESLSYGWYLPVAGTTAAQILTVTYDGLAQTYDLTTGERDAGVADSWYARDGAVLSGCPTAEWTGEFATVVDGNCVSLYGYRVPYFADLGWAAPGRRWLVVAAIIDPVLSSPRVTAGGIEPYDVGLNSVFISINDAGPVGSAGTSGPPVYSSAPDPAGYQIFDVPQGAAALKITAAVTVDYLPVGATAATTSKSGDIVVSFDVEVP